MAVTAMPVADPDPSTFVYSSNAAVPLVYRTNPTVFTTGAVSAPVVYSASNPVVYSTSAASVASPIVYRTSNNIIPSVYSFSSSPSISTFPVSYSSSSFVPTSYKFTSPVQTVVAPAVVPQPSPVVYSAAPEIEPGYVAKTPGSEHLADLPVGLGYASHHINLQKAPGTE